MNAPHRRSDRTLEAVLNPKSIAVVGASTNPDKIGGRPIAYCKRFGFSGPIYPINPNSPTVQDLQSFGRLADVPEAPDLAVIALPKAEVFKAVEDCAAKGVGAAVIMTSGFAETGDEGAALQARMAEIAAGSGMYLVGPNTQGVANFGNGAVASFATMFTSTEPADGPVAVISQSGAMSVVPYALLRERGVGVRHAHATGNEAGLSIADFTYAIAQDPDIKLILLYFESIKDPDLLEHAAKLARERNLPIIALKAGRSEAGQAAATSHTGALAVTDKVIDAYLESCRIWRAPDLRGLVNATELYLTGRKPKDRRVAIMSNSGASCVMAADLAENAGLNVKQLDATTEKALGAVLPGFATAGNPIDLTAALLTNNKLFSDVLEVLQTDTGFDLAMVTVPNAGKGYDIAGFAKSFASFGKATGAAIASAMPQADARAIFAEAGVPSYTYDTDALEGLGQLARHWALMRRPEPPRPELTKVTLPTGSGAFLDEAASLELLAHAGVETARFKLCDSLDDAVEAYDAIGGEVVLKACSDAFPHKSEHGLVLLSIKDMAGLRAGFLSIRKKLVELGESRAPILVAESVKARWEFVVGAQYDREFGALVMVGDGGKYVEALKDYILIRYPFSPEDFEQAINRLKIAPIFKGVRGEPPFDLGVLGDLAFKVGWLVAAAQGQIASIDMNPVMACPDGRKFTVVDALLERGQAGTERFAK